MRTVYTFQSVLRITAKIRIKININVLILLRIQLKAIKKNMNFTQKKK